MKTEGLDIGGVAFNVFQKILFSSELERGRALDPCADCARLNNSLNEILKYYSLTK